MEQYDADFVYAIKELRSFKGNLSMDQVGEIKGIADRLVEAYGSLKGDYFKLQEGIKGLGVKLGVVIKEGGS